MAARSKYAMTAAKMRRFTREKRGTGEGAKYRPWLKVGDVPSRGRSHRLTCFKTGLRQMHFFSDHEYAAFLDAWWDPSVTDIREQYPLDLQETVAIAAQLGIEHPSDKSTGLLIVQTTDLLLTRDEAGQRCYAAKIVKDASALEKKREREKIDIQRAYWHQRGVPAMTLINDGLNDIRARNLNWLFDFEAQIRRNVSVSADCSLRLLEKIGQRVGEQADALCLQLDVAHNAEPGSHLTALRFLLYARAVHADMNSRSLFLHELNAYKVNYGGR